MPRLVLIGAIVLEEIVQEFLVAHPDPMRLAISPQEPDITFSYAAQPSSWARAVTTRAFWEVERSAGELHRLLNSVHLVALSLHIGRISAFLSANLAAPHIETLEICPNGRADYRPPLQAHWIRVPLLQHFVLDISGAHADVPAHSGHIEQTLDTLRQNFRTLLVYGVELLETVTVRVAGPVARAWNCSYFARFARRYVEIS